MIQAFTILFLIASLYYVCAIRYNGKLDAKPSVMSEFNDAVYSVRIQLYSLSDSQVMTCLQPQLFALLRIYKNKIPASEYNKSMADLWALYYNRIFYLNNKNHEKAERKKRNFIC